MDEKIKIIGGDSSPRRIAIRSKRFSATARASRDGSITCDVQPVPALLQFIVAHPRLPIPRLFIMMVFMLSNPREVLRQMIVTSAIRFLVLKPLFDKFLPDEDNAVWQKFIAAVVGGVWKISRTARWHGAEHMAISAYSDSGSTDLEVIRRESPVNDLCGGRVALPTIGVAALASRAAKTDNARLAAQLVSLEAMLWLDKCWGLHRIPGLAQTSRLLQRYATTRQPSELELLTAQRAIQELVAADRP